MMVSWFHKYLRQPQGIAPTVLFLFLSSLLSADVDTRIDNSNFTISDDSTLYNYNRLRLRSDFNHENFFATFIGDGINYYGQEYLNSISFGYIKEQKSDTTFKTQTDFNNYKDGTAYAKLYRLYGGWEDNKNRIVLGLQNISMGVGRIWTPTNIFNPKNSYTLEPDEVFPVMALSYTRYIDDTSQLTLVSSQKADDSFKSALRYKTFLDIADFAIDIISSDDTEMIGYEIEGNLADTGVELRSEGVYIRDDLDEFSQFIFGADYGFKNGITVVGELLYNSETFSFDELMQKQNSDIFSNMFSSNLYTALGVSKSFNIFLDGSLNYISSLDSSSSFLFSTLSYTLNDYNIFSLGTLVYDGDEFQGVGNSYYFKYSLSL